MTKSDKKVFIIGAGAMTRAIAYDLLTYEPTYKLNVIDNSQQAIDSLTSFLGDAKVNAACLDASDPVALKSFMEDADLAIGSASYKLNEKLAKLAVETNTHWVDLGGNNTVVSAQFALHDKASQAGVCIFPDCGLAPGMVNTLAAHAASQFDKLNSMEIRVGGLPQNPTPPLFYNLLFSPDGLANEYAEPCLCIANGELKTVEPLTGWERVWFGAPYGLLEAFNTSGGASTLIDTYLGKIDNLNYKTLRYPGHLRRVKLLLDMGYFDDGKLELPSGATVSPREITNELLQRLGWADRDVTLVKLTVEGSHGNEIKKLSYRITDEYDEETGLTSMMRMTGFSATLVGRSILEDKIDTRGTLKQEEHVPTDFFLAGLKLRKIDLQVDSD